MKRKMKSEYAVLKNYINFTCRWSFYAGLHGYGKVLPKRVGGVVF